MATKRKPAEGSDEITTALNVVIPEIQMRTLHLEVEGLSPLIVDCCGPHVVQAIRDTQEKKANQGYDVRDPWKDFCNSLYWISARPASPTAKDIAKATFGFPARAFKSAAIDAGTVIGKKNMTKTLAMQAFHVMGHLLPIKGPPPEMREDFVRPNGRGGNVRFRGMFREWVIELAIHYNARAVSPAQVVNLINTAGISVGIGNWCVKRKGNFGLFQVKGQATREI